MACLALQRRSLGVSRAVPGPNKVFEVLGVGDALGCGWLVNYVLEKVQLGPRAIGVLTRSVEKLLRDGVPEAAMPKQPNPSLVNGRLRDAGKQRARR